MADLATLTLRVDSSGAIRAVDQFGNAVDATAKRTDKLATAAKAAGVALAGAFVYAMHKTVEETKAAQFAQAQLEAALRSTGGIAGQSSKALNDHAAALQRVTTYGDDAVVAMQSVLLTFTRIRGDVFPLATEAVLDMAARLGTDLQGAAIQVGKALNDPITGVKALGRAGVQFSDEQQAMIERLVETNQFAKAQGVILAELQVQFGGSAREMRNTLGGALVALGNTWGDLFEISRDKSQGIIGAIEAINRTLPRLRDGANELILEWDVLATRMAMATTHMAKDWAKLRLFTTINPETRRDLRGVIAGYDDYLEKLRALHTQQELSLANDVGARLEREAKARRDAANATQQQAAALAALNAASDPLARRELSFGHMTGTTHGFGPRPIRSVPRGPRLDSFDPAAEARERMEWERRIAEQFSENMQRATGEVFAAFVRDGKLSVRDVFDGLGNMGSQLFGQALSKSLMPKIDSLSSGQQMGVGFGLGLVGSVFDGIVNSGRELRAQFAAIAEATRQFERSVGDWRMSAAEWAMSPTERAAFRVSSTAGQFGREAFDIYRNTPRPGDQGRFFEMLARTGFKTTGDWRKDLDAIQALSPAILNNGLAGPLREYLDALRLIAEGYEENTEAATRQAAAERALALGRTASALTAFGRDLKLSNLSIYNPFQKSQTAEAEYNRIVDLARRGDQDAAGQLPAAARAFLEASRGINASGSRYVQDFLRVERDAADLAGFYRSQEEINRDIADGISEVESGITITNDILTRTEPYLQAAVTVAQANGETTTRLLAAVEHMSANMDRRLRMIEEVIAA